MRMRLIICAAAVAVGAAAVPALAATSSPSPTLPPACVVVNGPNGAHLQVGYAPGGPADCTTLP